MLYDRREQILSMLEKDGIVKVSDLTATFGVSIETIRRDLEALEKEDLLKRVYGGAILKDHRSKEPTFQKRQEKNADDKYRIGRLASTFVEDGDVIAIDLGTTTMEMAIALKEKATRVIAITNSIPIAAELSKSENAEVILIGGHVRGGELSVGGDVLTETNMRMFQTDKIFLGVGGLTEAFGITDYKTEEMAFRRIGVERTQKVFALADHSKFGVTAMNQICELDRIDTVITDSKTNRTMINAIKERGVKVLVAE